MRRDWPGSRLALGGGLPVALVLLGTALPDSALAATRTSAFAPVDPGVRAAAMGGAYTAVGGDPMALYWNPATLFYQRGRALQASYTDMYGLGLARRSFLTFGIKTLIDEPTFRDNKVVVRKDRESGAAYAFGLQSLFLDLEENGYSEFSLDGGAAWGYGDRFAVGVRASGLFISSDFDNVSAIGYNLGFGISWRYSTRERLAVAVPHLFSRLFWDFDTTERLPVGAKVGWSREFFTTITAALEAEWRESESGPYRVGVGAEWWWFGHRLAWRAGYRHLTDSFENVNQPSAGVAVRFGQVQFDYAYRMERSELGDSHRIGLLAMF